MPRSSAVAVQGDPEGPAAQLDKGGVEQPESLVRPRQQQRVRRSVPSAFDPGPQRTSTPSPTYNRRDTFPAVPSPAAPKSRSPAGSRPRPVFEPVVAAVPSGTDQLPVPAVQLPAAPGPTFHFRKPDVISDVNEDVAEPLRPAPRTDRRRQRTSGTSQSASRDHQPVPDEPPRPTIAAKEDSSSDTSSSGSESDDSESSRSDEEAEYLLAKTQRQVKSPERQPGSGFGEKLPSEPLEGTGRARVRRPTLSRSLITTSWAIKNVPLYFGP